jgi:hypothetical protein
VKDENLAQSEEALHQANLRFFRTQWEPEARGSAVVNDESRTRLAQSEESLRRANSQFFRTQRLFVLAVMLFAVVTTVRDCVMQQQIDRLQQIEVKP